MATESDHEKKEIHLKKVEEYTEQIAANPNDADLYTDRAYEYEKCSLYEDDRQKEDEYFKNAIADYTTAIEKDSDNADRYYYRANSYYSMLRMYLDFGTDTNIIALYAQNAIKDYTKVLELYKSGKHRYEQYQCYQDRAMNYYYLAGTIDNYEKAQEYFEKSIQDMTTIIDKIPDYFSCYIDRGDMYSAIAKKLTNKNKEKTLEYFEKAVADFTTSIQKGYSPKNHYKDYLYRAYTYCNMALENQNDDNKIEEYLGKAIEDFSTVIDKKSDNADVYNHRGETYFDLAHLIFEKTDSSKAIEYYKKALDDWHTFKVKDDLFKGAQINYHKKEAAEKYIRGTVRHVDCHFS